MSLKSVFREIKRSLTFWHEIEYPPAWVWKTYRRWVLGDKMAGVETIWRK